MDSVQSLTVKNFADAQGRTTKRVLRMTIQILEVGKNIESSFE